MKKYAAPAVKGLKGAAIEFRHQSLSDFDV